LAIRKLVWPLRTILFKLTEEAEVKQEFIYIRPVTAIYFRDVYDHVIRLIDIIDVSREIITSSMEGYLSMISNNLNLVMKKLTSIMTILMIPGLIASIYGMNFEYMPELNMPYGYAVILGVMAASAILSYYFFHRKDWI
jgi:magnesium transporter